MQIKSPHMDSSAGARMLKAMDLAALALWLALERSTRFACALARPFATAALKTLSILAGKPPVSRLLKNPLARELHDLTTSPTTRKLWFQTCENLLYLKEKLDKSKVARRLLLAFAALLILRTTLWEESGPPRGAWRSYGPCVASYYDKGFLGKPTASGEIFSPYEFTAAHRSLPFNSYLKLRNIGNGRETVVRINDRGPFVDGRDIDLSRAAAKALGMLDDGLARVEALVLKEKAPGGS